MSGGDLIGALSQSTGKLSIDIDDNPPRDQSISVLLGRYSSPPTRW